ncbi:methionine adenosyltransferase 2 subunit beta [Thecamonas trahens ATCC 50062]|uniref:Methionine adenosyltransferase 2 subunit beta n=1 Tax=Thecamonas trahens ATCC 50062 TaxID=461836 RepID=A0A0L0D5L0_THETB|nr:methionine adenosyltransferase 2 subunit beta [Thecamonas trahens ATCC 50062]KNC47629.1 methionine adenosyltransferase 2 subunit beta [Thecamonas trahens ATCC 50062]|eukprot:XP_013759549.1 methionine adenosyltransferase 2 subunit beta [Thecamonas trahens ATCC 50062]
MDSPGKTVLVTGATGLLGRAVVAALASSPHAVAATGWSRVPAPGDSPFPSVTWHKADLTDPDARTALLADVAPHAILHLAAERRPDACKDPDRLAAFNVELPRALAEHAAASGAWLLYISTDYVFPGSNPPYAEDATPAPLNDYGVSKAAGEDAVRLAAPECATILRVPILYGSIESLGESALTAIAEPLRDLEHDTRPLLIDNWAARFPTHVDDVARVIAALLALPVADLAGTLHFSGSEQTTKYKVALLMLDILGLAESHIALIAPNPNPPPGAPRPQNAQLSCARLLALLNAADLADLSTPLIDGLTAALQPFASDFRRPATTATADLS